MPALKAEIFEVRSDLIKWIADKPIAVRQRAKSIIMNLAIASREPDCRYASVADLLADQVEQLQAVIAEKRWHWRSRYR